MRFGTVIRKMAKSYQKKNFFFESFSICKRKHNLIIFADDKNLLKSIFLLTFKLE